ncbi:hypothetical protein GALL_384600 [mine drainage metagenome]|uniref:Uncharacterized protein n=1 Tax=mine drainage metagenome TaxID=410659 RepID=A0A1J5QII7_9ZZZZ
MDVERVSVCLLDALVQLEIYETGCCLKHFCHSPMHGGFKGIVVFWQDFNERDLENHDPRVVELQDYIGTINSMIEVLPLLT